MIQRIQSTRVLWTCSHVRLLAFAAIAVLFLSACGGATETPTLEPTPEQPAVTEPEVVAAPADTPTSEPTPEPMEQPEATAPQTTGITVAVNASFKPFLFMDDNNQLAGFDIDIMNALSAVGDFEVAYENRQFDGMLNALAAGEYDAAMAAITINDARKELVDFTAPYFEPGQAPVSFFSGGQGIGVRSNDTEILGVDDFTAGTIIGVKRGTTGDDFASQLESVTVVRFDESDQTLDALVDGAVDAAIVDIAVITDYIKESQGKVKLVGGPVTEEEYGIAVNKDRTDVLQMLDDSLTQIREDGTYDQIFTKWFGTP